MLFDISESEFGSCINKHEPVHDVFSKGSFHAQSKPYQMETFNLLAFLCLQNVTRSNILSLGG